MEIEQAVFGGGCFWCTEALFRELRGVERVVSGYAGGEDDRPTYERVSGGNTGHAEVISIHFDPSQITYHDLLTVFFATHDPTTLNRQGADVGTQYRSIILYTTESQKEAAEAYIETLIKDGVRVVTTVEPLRAFYAAEEYHQAYYQNNKSAPYCALVIEPKLEKLHAACARLLKEKKK
jgi:peptide-methionine (S)-S-oxide reductase